MSALRRVAVFDGTRPLPRQDILIDGPVIAAVGHNLPAPADATIVVGTGRTLLPGLIDAHTHATNLGQLWQSLVFGVTTELDMGGTPELARTSPWTIRRRSWSTSSGPTRLRCRHTTAPLTWPSSARTPRA